VNHILLENGDDLRRRFIVRASHTVLQGFVAKKFLGGIGPLEGTLGDHQEEVTAGELQSGVAQKRNRERYRAASLASTASWLVVRPSHDE
jgi:hypothetical protein